MRANRPRHGCHFEGKAKHEEKSERFEEKESETEERRGRLHATICSTREESIRKAGQDDFNATSGFVFRYFHLVNRDAGFTRPGVSTRVCFRCVRLLPQREKRRTKEQGTWKVLFAHPCIYARRLVDWVYRSGVHSALPRVVLAGVDFEFVLVPHLIHHVHVLEVTLI